MKRYYGCALGVALLAPAVVRADGMVVDKIYHPYVDALENELEYRALAQDAKQGFAGPAQRHQLSLGRSIGSRLFGEVYAVANRARDGSVSVDAWEAELKWQLTEQGEYAADWGLLFEYENERRVDAQEFSVTLLVEKEWGDWSGAANLHVINEWGDDIAAELETALALQARYRYSRLLEPGVELFAGQGTRGIGPVLQGTFNTRVRQSLHWEAGLILGLDADSPNRTWRFLMEYEF
ncbi:MAG: hypothetical protein RLZZ227_2907 [Pseudomonadota bacterium]|jgi:hypothetical protein